MYLPSASPAVRVLKWGWYRGGNGASEMRPAVVTCARSLSLLSLSTHTIYRSARLVAEAPRLVRVRVRMINLLTMINRPTLTLTLTLTLTPTSVRLMPL